jgi:hypothetical protein
MNHNVSILVVSAKERKEINSIGDLPWGKENRNEQAFSS